MLIRFLAIIVLFVAGFTIEAGADTVHLKNGRSIEGLVEKEDEETVVLNVGFGTVKFKKTEIENIEKSKPGETEAIEKEWQTREKMETEKRQKRQQELEEARRKKELEPKEVGFSDKGNRIVVSALINNKVNASLLLDTGASIVMLSESIAKQLKINTKVAQKDIMDVQVADGRKVKAVYVVLDSLSVQGVEAKNVDASILLDAEENIEDGLLGMSFLNKFNFQIDSVNKKLILKKPE